MKFITPTLATLAFVLCLMLAYLSFQTMDRLERIDRRLDSVQAELVVIKSPDWQSRQLDGTLDRMLSAMRAEQMQRLAKAQ
ncbi:hypothetical protein ACP4J5_17365 [Pseudomonas oryzihabitans]|uniref:hypothetical protein n=1 Tax=Pseudomonas oryzihabitans TaxID=47885 RepID=UPI003CE7CC89